MTITQQEIQAALDLYVQITITTPLRRPTYPTISSPTQIGERR